MGKIKNAGIGPIQGYGEVCLTSLAMLEDLSAEVALIDSRPNRRTEFAQALRTLGFRKLSAISTFSALFSDKAACYKIDWLILVVESEAFSRVIHNLVTLTELPGAAMAISVFLADTDPRVCPIFFELGAVSCHNVDFRSELLATELRQFLRTARLCRSDPVFTAAHGLRAILRKLKNYQELVNFETALSKAVRVNRPNLLELAEAHSLVGNIPFAICCVQKMVYFFPGTADRLKKFEATYLKHQLDRSLTFAERYQVQRVLFVHKEDEHSQLIRAILKRMGIGSVVHRADSNLAWQALSSEEPFDLIITDWTFLSAPSGVNWLQRLRAYSDSVPILLMVDPIPDKRDKMINDLRITGVIHKPANPKQTLMAVAWGIAQAFQPTETRTLEHRILACLERGEFNEATCLKRRFMGLKSTSSDRKNFIDAWFALKNDNPQVALKILNSSRGDVPALAAIDIKSLLARCFEQIGDYSEAKAKYEQILAELPEHIGFVCRLTELLLLSGERDAAKRCFEKTSSLDPDNPRCREVLAKIALTDGDLATVIKILSDPFVRPSLLTYINERALRMAQDGKSENAVNILELLLQYAGPHKDLLPLIHYNMAVVLLRAGIAAQADNHLEQAKSFGTSPVYQRSVHLSRELAEGAKATIDWRKQFMGHEEGIAPAPLGLKGIYAVADDNLRRSLDLASDEAS